MTPILHNLVLAAFTALMAMAALEDFRRYAIPNWLTLSVCVLWPAFAVPGAPLSVVLSALGCALAVFAVGAVLFARGYVGGGDVKLLAVAVLWAGAANTPGLLILTGLLGGVLALILLSPLGTYLFTGARGWLDPPQAPEGSKAGPPVPYGIAIAAAALIVILPPQFG